MKQTTGKNAQNVMKLKKTVQKLIQEQHMQTKENVQYVVINMKIMDNQLL